MNRDQKRDVIEGVGLLAIVGSLIFLALEIRQNTIQAQAAAFQALGTATSEWFLSLDDRDNRLLTEANYSEALERWTLSDWEAYISLQTAGLRWVETFLLQVEQGLLEEDAMTQWGFSFEGHPAMETVGFVCIWPDLSGFVGANLRSEIDEGLRNFDAECPVDLPTLRDQTILGK